MARNIGVNFNGKNIVHPGAHSRTNSDSLTTLGTAGSKRIAFVGTSEGGQPGVVHTFDNPADARDVLRGGDLFKAGDLAWTPSGDGVGAGSISFLRVSDAKQSTLTKGGLVLTSKDWGEFTKNIQVKLEPGTAAGSKRLTAYLWTDETREVFDNIGPIFTVKYKGTGETATLSIVEDSQTKKAKTLALKVGTTDVMSFQLGDGEYADINKIIYKINENKDFEAAMVTFGNKNLKSDALDIVANQIIKDVAYTVTALKGDLLYQTRYSKLINVSFGTGEIADFDFTYLTGGTEGEVPASWAKEFNKLFGEGCYIVVPLTGDAAIHAECARFINNQSVLERNKMIGIYGGKLGESVDDAIGRALTFNSSRAVVAYPGITRAINSDEQELLPPYFTAAMIAGRIAGKPTGEPVTLNFLNLIGLEKVLTATEIDRLIQSGVTCVEFVRQTNKKGYRIVQGVTTYQVDTNPSFREISMRILDDELSTELVEHLESKFAGGKGTVSSIALIKNETQAFLDKKVREEVIVTYQPESVVVRLVGDQVFVDYSCIPVGAINYILITAKYYQQQILA